MQSVTDLCEALDNLNQSLVQFHDSFVVEKTKLLIECAEYKKYLEEQGDAETNN